MKIRLDQLVSKQLCVSREYAKEIISDGKCLVDGRTILRAGTKFADDTIVDIHAQKPQFVSRGGIKLAKALDEFDINVEGLRCLDIGASTGGFTDCMLQRGAMSVISLDNGHGQLAQSLLNDSRVTSMEDTDIRNITLDDLPYHPDFITCDVSFISLAKIIPSVSLLFARETKGVFLLKPQFECGLGHVNKHGVVTNLKAHADAIESVTFAIKEHCISVCDICQSPIAGKNINTEYLMYVSPTQC